LTASRSSATRAFLHLRLLRVLCLLSRPEMGTFAGHALPGSFFIFFSVWGLWDLLRRFYRRRAYELHLSSTPEPKYYNRVSSPLTGGCNGRGLPLDSMLKAITCLIGITGEVITGFKDGKFVHIGNIQHCTMYSTFALSGIAETLMYYGIIKTSVQVEYVFNFVALLSEGFLFLFHLHGRTPLDIYLHMLLLGMILLAIISGFAEVYMRDQPIYAIVRNWSILVQGTWFWQVGAILYPAASWMPVWDGISKESIPAAANLFCYHLLVDFVGIVLLASVMSLRLGRIDFRAAAKPFHTQHPEHTIEDLSADMSTEMTLYAASAEAEDSRTMFNTAADRST
ncbi:Transmembrane protein 45B, partial [Clonorchis sinensis]